MNKPKSTINSAQQAAIEYIDGPLLIVAGAGTGKTTVITEKIKHLIESKQAKPEEILALTFTDKAAEEMQERIDSMLAIDYAEMYISTFHSFCQRLLEQYAIDIGLPNQYELITDTDAWLLMREHLHEFDLDYYRPLGNPYRHIHEFLKHFSKCKDELIEANDYLSYAEEQQADNTQTEEKNRLIEIAKAYHRYNELLLDHGKLDFGDILFHAVRLLRTRPTIKQALQKQFKFILVDEFQDVNYAQYAFIQLLAEQSQLTVVGDDDQSIYAFRGASVSNILHFQTDYPTAKKIVLNENYRSGQAILDASYRLIQQNNPDRLEIKLQIDKSLQAKGAIATGTVHHLHAPTLHDEVQSVVQEIAQLKQQEPTLAWDDIAILVRANSHATPFIDGLERAGIPYEFLASQGLYNQPIVLDCLNFFKAIDNIYDATPVYRLLRLPFLSFPDHDLQQVVYMSKRKSISYVTALQRPELLQLSQEGIALSKKIVSWIYEGVKKMKSEKPSAVLFHFLEKSGYLTYLTQQETAGNREVIRQIYQLYQFFKVLKSYEQLHEDAHVKQFLLYYEYSLEAGDQGKLYQPVDTPDSVNIMTIHASKGLEFPYVFMVNMVEDRFPSRRRGDAIDLPVELVKEHLPEGDYHYQEERRLCYVAMTRAKQALYLTSASDYGGSRTKKISRFLTELGYTDPRQFKTSKQDNSIETFGEHHATHTKEPEVSELRYPLPKSFSFSQIRSYQTCPYQYKLAHILKLPMKGSHSFSFGNTIHNTLQQFYERVQQLNQVTQASLFSIPSVPQALSDKKTIPVPSLQELLSLYEEKWIDDWYADQKQRESYFKKGKEILTTFYTAQEGKWSIPVALESGFKIMIGGHVLKGKIDRVDQLPDGSLEIIDYKTGTGKETLTSEDKEQLLIYQIAAETLPEYKHLGPTATLTFYYVNDNMRTSFIGKDKELIKIKEKVEASINGIIANHFTATPNPHICKRCDFRDICEYKLL